MTTNQNVNDKPSIGIVGAGLVGCLAALAFTRKGYDVNLFDLRPNPSSIDRSRRNLRSINLAVSNRGLRAVEYVDEALSRKILEHVIPMQGRMVHDKTGLKQESQLYGLHGECINSIDRSYLNDLLLEELAESGVKVYFEHKLVKLGNVDTAPTMEFAKKDGNVTFGFDYIIGADGAHSHFRHQMQKGMRMDFSQKYIDMQYMELYIPPDPEKKFAIDANHLHIWPRHDFMLIALANEDGSFTSTFFSPWHVIESITSSSEFTQFFKTNFPDAYNLIGEEALVSAFDNNPRGSLMQISAYPYNSPHGKAIIIGDAAHSMVPFYGQGMNCGFEDVRILMELIEANEGNIEKAFLAYSPQRKDDLDAICKLALDNYYEMSSKVTNIWYLVKKKLDYTLGSWFENRWLPLYTMISFRDDIPYSKAVTIEAKQSRILNNLQIGLVGSILVYGAVQGARLYEKWKYR
ncbi:BNA4 [Candida theae]|uniref:Kynurenine 3-monooxygenase n=1 Tax=Candida theae TaxID=1198502 RepID=A0AAD5BJD5_9ASCO|nr:BNA4 [Candida theae]KAI5968425.1 BNA4 [Candida theae]